MIIDSIEHFGNYCSLSPRFDRVARFLEENDISVLPKGHYQIDGEDLFVNIVECSPKSRSDARLESHDRMIDIQIPLTASEEHGWSARCNLPEAEYDSANDISFYEGAAQSYFKVGVGQFAVYFPQDCHAPAITAEPLRKAIFKVKA